MATINAWNSNIPVEISKGGTASTSFNTTGIVISGATSTGALTSITLTDGQLAIGSSIGNPAAATITAGTGISVTNGHNSITIAATGSGGITTIDGDSGSMTGSTVTISGGTTGLTTSASSATMDLTGTLIVANGGTGIATMTTAYAPVCAGTTATGALQVASTGLSTSGFVLTSNGSSALPSFKAAAAGALTLIATKSGSGVTFTSGISGTYNNYLIISTNWSSATGSDLMIQISTNGGSSYISTGYVNCGAFAANTSGLVIGYNARSSSNFGYSSAYLYNLGNGTNYITVLSEVTAGILPGGSPSSNNNVGNAGFYNTVSTTATAFKIIGADGNAVSGLFSLYSYSN